MRAELRERGVADEEARVKTRAYLDRVMLSVVFDLDGLWEVLADLDRPEEAVAKEEETKTVEEEEEEIADSQDEDDEPLSPPPPPAAVETARIRPDVVVITHFSSLLTSLFTHREKSAAHAALQLLGARMRHLVRSLPSCPLMLLLNSTSSSFATSTSTSTTSTSTSTSASTFTAAHSGRKHQQPLDPTLRSIFNPPPPPAGYTHAAGPATSWSSSRQNKPSFGMVFAQLLDVHLLATRLPRGVVDAEVASLQQQQQQQQIASDAAAALVRTVWVVEVLLDEVGVWEGMRGVRRSREQRWTAVDVDHGRVRDAFGKMEGKG